MIGQIDKRLERLIFFSDGVIAIAITLLVIEIKIPHFEKDDPTFALDALNGLSPSFFGFVLSFLVIGRFWSGHSAALSDMVKYDPRLSRPNLLFLMAIALMPFATAFMTHNIGQLVPTLFYNATLLVTALLSFWVIRIATDRSSNCSMHDPDEASGLRFRAVLAIGGCLLAVSLAFVAPSYSQVPLIPLLVWERFQWVWKRKSS